MDSGTSDALVLSSDAGYAHPCSYEAGCHGVWAGPFIGQFPGDLFEEHAGFMAEQAICGNHEGDKGPALVQAWLSVLLLFGFLLGC